MSKLGCFTGCAVAFMPVLMDKLLLLLLMRANAGGHLVPSDIAGIVLVVAAWAFRVRVTTLSAVV